MCDKSIRDSFLGKGKCIKWCQNTGIAKKGGGGLTLPRFFCGFDSLKIRENTGISRRGWGVWPCQDFFVDLILWTKVTKSDQYPPKNWFCHQNLASRIRTFVVESTSVPGLGEGGDWAKSWQCQYFSFARQINFHLGKKFDFSQLATALGNHIGDQNSQSS